jgi:hypothetical protein
MRFIHQYLAPTPAEQDEIRDEINQAVRGSHLSKIKVWTATFDTANWREHPLVDPTGWNEAPRFEILSGEVTEHYAEAVSRELNLTVASEYWDDPFDALADVSPYRTLIAVARGIHRPDATTNPDRVLWSPLGVYRVWNVDTAGNAEGGFEIPLRAYSLEVDVRAARFLQTPMAGTGPTHIGARAIRDVIHRLVETTFPNSTAGDLVPFDIISEGSGLGYQFPIGAVLTDERDRLDLILGLQDDRDVWGRFDRVNHYRIDTMPAVTDTPVPFVIDTGENGVMVSYGKEYTRNQVYNAVLAFGEYGGANPGDPQSHVSYLAIDDDPTSPTFYDGPYGRVPRFQRVGFLPNDATQAAQIVEDAAEAILARSLDFKAGISFDAVPNPLLEAGDVVQVKFPVGPRGGNAPQVENHLITSLSIGLGADTQMSADTIVMAEELPEMLRMA